MTSTSKRTKSITSDKKANTRVSLEAVLMLWADSASLRSTCARLSVGAVIMDKDLRRVLGYGYNGNYSGGPNKCDGTLPGQCGCIHAEMNALISSVREKDAVMFVTDAPCLTCAKCIINAGISQLYYEYDYRDASGLKLLKKKIKVEKLIT